MFKGQFPFKQQMSETKSPLVRQIWIGDSTRRCVLPLDSPAGLLARLAFAANPLDVGLCSGNPHQNQVFGLDRYSNLSRGILLSVGHDTGHSGPTQSADH